jgi:nitrite reductase/ring-hydroxylating ferredoxin subunit
MLSKEDNELLTRVGPGTPMGTLMRRYWLPALLSAEVPGPDSDPVRVRLLGEDLIAFRDSSARVGLLANNCPHRGASLFFGRNEENGLRCVYHGWKFEVDGTCVDMPNEPAESDFKSKVKATAYPTHESGGIVWTYMGPPEHQLPFRDFGTDVLPRSQWRANKLYSSCNFVQAMEGNLDTAHISFLHRNFEDLTVADDGSDKPGFPTPLMSTRIRSQARDPRVEVLNTPHGLRYVGLRTTPNGHTHARMTVFVMPVMTFVAAIPFGGSCGMFVPIDDEQCWRYQVKVHANEGIPGRISPGAANRPVQRIPGLAERIVLPENDYLIDRQRQRTFSYTGIVGVVEQDLAVTESMGPIQDRTVERLGTTDLAIIRMRQQLINAAVALQRGIDPPGLDPTLNWREVHSSERILTPGQDWHTMATADDPDYLRWIAEEQAALTPV